MDWMDIYESTIGSLIASAIWVPIAILGVWILRQGKGLVSRYMGKENLEKAEWLSFRRRTIIGITLIAVLFSWMPPILEPSELVIWYDVVTSLVGLVRFIFAVFLAASLTGILFSQPGSKETIQCIKILIVAGAMFSLITGIRGHLERERDSLLDGTDRIIAPFEERSE